MSSKRAIVRPVDLERDIQHVAAQLRAVDRREITALTGRTDYAAVLLHGASSSTYAFTAELDGEPVALVGCGEGIVAGVGVPWMLGTDRIPEGRVQLVRDGKRWVAAWNERWPLLINYVSAENRGTRAWLDVLGFIIDETPIYFADPDCAFHLFRRERTP